MGGIDYLTRKEIDRLKEDEEGVRIGLQANREMLANALKNGIGEGMLKDLNDMKNKPIKKENKLKTWFNKWIRKIY